MQSKNDIIGIANSLCAAVMRHAELVDREIVNPAQAVPAESQVRGLATAYRIAAVTRTGQDVDFGEQAEHATRLTGFEGPNRRSRTTEEAESGNIVVIDKYFVRVYEPARFAEYARHRLGKEFEDIESAVRALCEQDGWHPENYSTGAISTLGRTTSVLE
jgi:hypothetical protein